LTAREEASAESRHAARLVRDMFVALIAEGFTEQQALVILGHAISPNSGPAGGAA
jgi:alkylation response protein AidB-like acyl-CoA dehydrogenase